MPMDGSFVHAQLCEYLISMYVERTGFTRWSVEVIRLKAVLYSTTFVNLVNNWVLVDFVGRIVGQTAEELICTLVINVNSLVPIDLTMISVNGFQNLEYIYYICTLLYYYHYIIIIILLSIFYHFIYLIIFII